MGIHNAVGIAFVIIVQFTHETQMFDEPISYTQKGNITLGGLFPLHYTSIRPDNYSLLSAPAKLQCKNYNTLGFRWMQAMLFAIDQINSRPDILPNLTLGFQLYDTCNSHSVAVTQSLYMVNALYDSNETGVSAVIGPTASDLSTVISNILSAYDIPQISYASTSRLLSDKNIYNSFLRTIPNDNEQAMAIVDLLMAHNWKWVGSIAGDNDYGRPGIAKVKEKAKEKGICIEYTGYVSKTMTDEALKQVATEVRDFNATVFILFISASHLSRLINELSLLNVTDKIWIASEAWATSDTIRNIGASHLQGTLGIATRGGAMPNFRSFLEGVSPLSQQENPFVREFWENSFGCVCPTCQGPKSNYTTNSTSTECNGTENLLMANKTTYLDWSEIELGRTFNIYLAVHVVAHALESITKCTPGSGLLEDNACPNIDSLETWQLLAYIRKVNFTLPDEDLPFFFDDNGDPQASYSLVSWVPRGNDPNSLSIEFVKAGEYSSRRNPRWSIDDGKLYWKTNNGEVPVSQCNPPCAAGTYRSRLSSDCCFECRPCPADEYSMSNNSEMCMHCQKYWMANANRTDCVPKFREYVRWNDAFGITFCCFVAVGVLMTLFVSGVFFKKRRTPLVKATNVELSFLLFFSIICCFLTPLFYVVEPQDWSCRARMVAFSISFTFSVAVILVKTLRVLTAFEARVPVKYSKRTKWLGEHLQILVVLLVSLVQAILCVVWLLVDPPVMTIVPSMNGNDTISIQCSTGGVGFLISVDGYVGALALLAFAFAFRSRKLPENFNEAKFITFSMLIFFIVWLSFIPAYFSTTGSMTTVVNCIAIFASTFGFIGCIFFPKLYVIFVTPERNTIEELRNNTVKHALRTIHKETTTRMRNSTDGLNVSPRLASRRGDHKANHNTNNNNNARLNTSRAMTFEKNEALRHKYLKTYNSLSEKEMKPSIPLHHGDSRIVLGIDKKVSSSFEEKTLKDSKRGELIQVNLNVKVNIKPTQDNDAGNAVSGENKKPAGESKDKPQEHANVSADEYLDSKDKLSLNEVLLDNTSMA